MPFQRTALYTVDAIAVARITVRRARHGCGDNASASGNKSAKVKCKIVALHHQGFCDIFYEHQTLSQVFTGSRTIPSFFRYIFELQKNVRCWMRIVTAKTIFKAFNKVHFFLPVNKGFELITKTGKIMRAL